MNHQEFDKVLVSLLQTIKANDFDVKFISLLDTIEQELDDQLSNLSTDRLIRFIDILHALTEKRQDSRYRKMAAIGELSHSFNRLGSIMVKSIYQHELLKDKINEYLVTGQSQVGLGMGQTEEEKKRYILKILDDSLQVAKEASEKFTLINEAVNKKTIEAEQYAQVVKAAKFQTGENKVHGITEDMKIKLVKMANEVFALSAAAALAADIAISTQICYEEMVKQTKPIFQN